MSKGIDVSHNATVTDWNKVKAAGIDFALIRCSLRQSMDDKWVEHINGANAVGLQIGIWHFAYPLTVADAVKEANCAVSLVSKLSFKPPIFYDYEGASDEYAANHGVTMTKTLRTAIHKAFCDRVKALGYVPGIYTNPDYILYKLEWDKLKGYALWLAAWPYGNTRKVTFDEIKPTAAPTKYGTVAIWQIGLGAVDGVKGDVDVNYGYITLPKKAAATVSTPATVTTAAFKVGDRVSVKTYTKLLGVKRAKLYGSNKRFVIYKDVYDVQNVSGKRIVIGFDGKATAAVDASILAKV